MLQKRCGDRLYSIVALLPLTESLCWRFRFNCIGGRPRGNTGVGWSLASRYVGKEPPFRGKYEGIVMYVFVD